MGKLKGIPEILSPEILHLLAVTGHGDEIVLADINFPTRSICSGMGGYAGEGKPKEYRADGIGIPALLDAILTLMPLDQYVPEPVTLMEMMYEDEEKGMTVKVWDDYRRICDKHQPQPPVEFKYKDRFQFYTLAKKAFAIIQTGETAPYANILLKRGVC